MTKMRAAIFGTGFMGRVHTENLRRLGQVEVAAVAGSSAEKARRFAEREAIEYATGNWRELIADPSLDVVHVCTPNAEHAAMATAALQAGKHVLCEKPLAATVAEGEAMLRLAGERGRAAATVYNLRCYPQVQNLRCICQAGELGEIWAVQGTYSQDWLLLASDWNWRVESGPSRSFADIGTHWCDLVEHVTGLRFNAVCAQMATFHQTRQKPGGSVETFAGKTLRPAPFTEVPIQTEDFAALLFELGPRARGAVTVSQIAAGRKNRVSVEIYGSKGSAAWDAERPQELWLGHRNAPNQIVIKDATLMHEGARSYAGEPGGHAEGYSDTFKQLFRRFYRRAADPATPVEYPTFEDGLRQLRLVDAVVRSARQRTWVAVEDY